MGYQAPTWANNGAPSLSAENMQQISNWLEYCSNNMVNPNLLDNWYFPNPVNQRNGKIIQQGVNIYADSTLETLIGPAAYACPVVELTSTYAKVQEPENTSQYYYAAPGNVVRGYTGLGYGIDRWKMWQAGGTVTVENGGIIIRKSSGEYVQWGEVLEADVWGALVGRQVTMSALTVNGQLATTTQTFTENGIVTATAFDGLAFHSVGNIRLIDFVLTGAESPAILAVGLELGSQQTIAHQDANGAWVLNEIPDYGEQLRRCQRYFVRIGDSSAGYTGMIGVSNCANATGSNTFIPTPVTLRATPAITLHNIYLRKGTTDHEVTSVNSFSVSANGIFCALNSSDLPAGETLLVRAINGGYMDLSADL